MELTAANVETVIKDCLYKPEEVPDQKAPADAVIVEGITRKFGFHPQRLEAHRQDIADMLSELPESFMSETGGGWSFLNACQTKTGTQWGEHRDMEALFVLGIGLKLAHFIGDRDLWAAFPGGMPYVIVDLKGTVTA